MRNLSRFKIKGSFLFDCQSRLIEVCNAPIDSSGIYLIYAINKEKEELIYIGISGRKSEDGKIIHRKGGFKGRFISGKQFGNRRQISWSLKMKEEEIKTLKIKWYVTYGQFNQEFPREIERELLSRYNPRWNKIG